MAKAVVYLQIEPEFSANGKTVWSAKVVRATQRDPGANQIGGTLLMKLTLDIDDGAFFPLEPEAIVKVPADLVRAVPIVVEAENPDSI